MFDRIPLWRHLALSWVQFSFSVMSDSLRPHGLQNARIPCPSPAPRACSTHVYRSLMPSNHLVLCLSLIIPPSIFPGIRVYSNESALHIRWPKYWNFSFNISLSNEYSGLISFRMEWLDILQSKRLSRVFSNITVQKHQLFGAQLSVYANSHMHTWPLEKP